MRRWRAALLLSLLLMVLGAVSTLLAAGSQTVLLPAIWQSSSGGLPPADEASHRITLPPGFAIRIFADGVAGARFMALGPDGALYVSQLSSGRITRLPDRDGDGRADAVEAAATGLHGPHGIEWRDNWLYVAEGDRISRLRDADGDGVLETRQLVTDAIPPPEGHSSRTLHFGPDGKLYVSVGSRCNIPVGCTEDDPRRAAILRFNVDGTIPADNPFAGAADPRRHPVWAEGLRNSVDFLWTPGGRLWADHNGSDGLGDDRPPEEVVIAVERGGFYGWPYCYTPTLGPTPAGTGEVRDARVPLPAGFDCAKATPALFTAPAHSAPLGMMLGPGLAFPAALRDDLFVAYHGSWNTDNPANYRDCKVERIVLESGVPVAAEPFATGWRAPGQKCGAAWGRPADVIVGADGSLLISDDRGGRVYRVVYVGE